ncbi:MULTISPECIES: hypothetical protein [unclassified Streptomyces]|uniref:hypothetical protein n=1 Tax=unclassified Streptomyces TaxID=2593676 RepID=UPI00324D78E2
MASLGTGLLLGLIGPAAGKGDNGLCIALSLIFSGGWPWACYAFLMGYFSLAKRMAALLSFTGLTVAVVAYYTFKHLYPTVPPGTHGTVGEGFFSGIFLWVLFALILGAPMGLAGYLARRRDFFGLLCRISVPLIAFFETNMRLRAEADGQGPVVIATWTTVQYASAAIVLALIGRTVWTSVRNRRAPESDDTYHAMSPNEHV